MIKAPDGYNLDQVFNDIMYLAVRLKALEDHVSNIWDVISSELSFQEGISSLGVHYRLLELEEKYKGLIENYGSFAIPLLREFELKSKKVEKEEPTY